jgi:hypothetical protein
MAVARRGPRSIPRHQRSLKTGIVSPVDSEYQCWLARQDGQRLTKISSLRDCGQSGFLEDPFPRPSANRLRERLELRQGLIKLGDETAASLEDRWPDTSCFRRSARHSVDQIDGHQTAQKRRGLGSQTFKKGRQVLATCAKLLNRRLRFDASE